MCKIITELLQVFQYFSAVREISEAIETLLEIISEQN